ncbi:MAG: hypothetical protein GY931_19360 [Maribacter sp.]|nr:hypothetical protein [Maribacter sp.]
MRLVIIMLVLVVLNSCQKEAPELINLNFEKDLIPEGIAIDSKSEIVFINSLRKNKIVKSKLDGSFPTEFIESNQYGYLSGFGMTIKGNTLFALGNSLPKKNNKSILLLLNLKTGDLINSYSINDSTFIYLNDLAISSKNDIYITDSESNQIYTVQNSSKKLEVYLEDDEIAHSNGISISDDDKYLYLASYNTGIRIIDIKSKSILNEPNRDYTGIDGMKYYNNSLIGIVNAKRDTSLLGVYRYYLDESKEKIIRKEKIVPYGEHFILPTTFDLIDGHIYYIINSQLNNFDQNSNQIIDVISLEPYFLMKKKLE